VEVAVAVVAARNQDFHAAVYSGYGIPGHQPGSWQEVVAIDAAVATDEVMVGEEKSGCLVVAVDVVTPCSVVRDELLVLAVGPGPGLVSQNDEDVSGSCAVAGVGAVVVAAAAVVEAAADDEGMVEVGDLRLMQHPERCRYDHQQQYLQYLTQLKCNKNLYLKTQIYLKSSIQ
jgi:hypothetical protein